MLPSLPFGNAKYVKQSASTCIWGAVADLLASPDLDTSKYTNFIVTNSGLRGPFLPAYSVVRYALIKAAVGLC